MPRKRQVVAFAAATVAAAVILGAAGFWVLVTPDNPLTSLFRRSISDTDARVIVGPYPVGEDLRLLQGHGVATIVSLLDPDLPYEGILLERERRLAGEHGIRVLNFPMSSILGQRFGEEYDANAAAAAAAIAGEKGKVYLHCYLGRHRIEAVQQALSERESRVGEYHVRRSERSADALALDRADTAFAAGRYRDTLAALDEIGEPDRAARMLRAWTHYRLGEVAPARSLFAELVAASPDDLDARSGLGYCALRDGDLDAAGEQFGSILAKAPGRAEALVGLGLVRYREDRWDAAARLLEAALGEDPRNDDARQTLEEIRRRQAAQPSSGGE